MDMTLCNGFNKTVECKLKHKCNRHLWSLDKNKVNQYYQSYFNEAPFIKIGSKYICDCQINL